MLTKLLLIYPLNYYKNPLDISTANNSPLRLRLDITDFGTVCIVLGLTLAEQIFSWQKITPGNINKSFIGENWTRKAAVARFLHIHPSEPFPILGKPPFRKKVFED